MKKVIRRMVPLLMAAVFVLSLMSEPVSAASVSGTAVAKYNQYISKYKIKSYKIADIDGNGIPELMAINRDSSAGKVYVFTYNKSTKKMQRLASMVLGRNYGVYYSISKHCFTIYTGSTGDCTYKVYKLKGTNLTKIATYTGKRNYPGFTWTYRKNNTKLSHSQWQKSLADYTTKYKAIPGNM